MRRDQTITTILENMTTMKRYIGACLSPSAEAAGLSPAQLEIVSAIHHSPMATATKLASQLHLTPGAISQLIEALEQQGYVERVTDPTDRRIRSLRLSTSGEQHLRAITKERQSLFKQIMHDMTDAELASWLHVQEKIISNLQNSKPKE